MKPSSFITSFFIILFFGHTAYAQSSLIFDNAWVAEAPPVSKVMAAYMDIKNPTDEILTIVAATSENFERVEFHLSEHKNNIASMKHIHHLNIPAKGVLNLKAGSYHMMLFNPVKKLTAGEIVNFKFELNNGSIIDVVMPVKKQDIESLSNKHHSHQHH